MPTNATTGVVFDEPDPTTVAEWLAEEGQAELDGQAEPDDQAVAAGVPQEDEPNDQGDVILVEV